MGQNSSDLVAGTIDTFAPKAMRLANGKLMRRRIDEQAVPHLLFSGLMSRHGSELMWTPWQYLEEITGNQDEKETAKQQRTRLQIFPLSKFSYIKEDSSDDEDN